ncbi:MAG: hypothetical protein M1822_006038 [Bathelium mastoideum]|nr:MAG: hypothetical protein M1822_006038 [Bathelium mastoideum]
MIDLVPSYSARIARMSPLYDVVKFVLQHPKALLREEIADELRDTIVFQPGRALRSGDSVLDIIEEAKLFESTFRLLGLDANAQDEFGNTILHKLIYMPWLRGAGLWNSNTKTGFNVNAIARHTYRKCASFRERMPSRWKILRRDMLEQSAKACIYPDTSWFEDGEDNVYNLGTSSVDFVPATVRDKSIDISGMRLRSVRGVRNED